MNVPCVFKKHTVKKRRYHSRGVLDGLAQLNGRGSRLFYHRAAIVKWCDERGFKLRKARGYRDGLRVPEWLVLFRRYAIENKMAESEITRVLREGEGHGLVVALMALRALENWRDDGDDADMVEQV